MPHVSKRILRKDVAIEISAKFVGALLKIQKLGGRAFVEELLTPTERIMLAKRLAIVYMLAEGRSYYRIVKTLGVSISTVKRLHEQVLKGRYTAIERGFKKEKDKEKLLSQLEAL